MTKERAIDKGDNLQRTTTSNTN